MLTALSMARMFAKSNKILSASIALWGSENFMTKRYVDTDMSVSNYTSIGQRADSEGRNNLTTPHLRKFILI